MKNERERCEIAIKELLDRRSKITHQFFETRDDLIEKNIGTLYEHLAWISFLMAVAMSKEGMSYGMLISGSLAIGMILALIIHHFRFEYAKNSKFVRPLNNKHSQEISSIDRDIDNYKRLLAELSDVRHDVRHSSRSR